VHKHLSDVKSNLVAMADLCVIFQLLWEFFDKDAADHGVYVPPICFQVLNKDGTVKNCV
jgi:hypothetical protein